MIRVTKYNVEMAFDILNGIVFEPTGMRVPVPDHLDIARLDGYLGIVLGARVDGNPITMCIMNEYFDSWDHFTEIMAHEMIHVYQIMVLGTFGDRKSVV